MGTASQVKAGRWKVNYVPEDYANEVREDEAHNLRINLMSLRHSARRLERIGVDVRWFSHAIENLEQELLNRGML